MVNLPVITGEIHPVPLSSYNEIIENYVEKVGKLEQVSSIIQMGSFSKPGISDIDLIVTLKDDMTYPTWDQISLKEISKSHKDAEIIAHDIFVIPESIGQNAEAYFYIDQQTVLKGDRLGGNMATDLAEKCKEFLALEYAVFSLDSIAGILLGSSVSLRAMILLISTMRHSANIGLSLKIINEKERDKIVEDVEGLRIKVLSSDYALDDFTDLLERFINLLGRTIVVISENTGKEKSGGHLKKSWMVATKTGMVGVEKEGDYLKSFLHVINKQKDSFISKFTKIFPVSINVQKHIGAYLSGNNKAAIYFRNRFRTIPVFEDSNELNAKAYLLRGDIVNRHWEFINQTGYIKSSGKAYCGLAYSIEKYPKAWFRKALLYYQLKTLATD